jgi:hypothetical protein
MHRRQDDGDDGPRGRPVRALDAEAADVYGEAQSEQGSMIGTKEPTSEASWVRPVAKALTRYVSPNPAPQRTLTASVTNGCRTSAPRKAKGAQNSGNTSCKNATAATAKIANTAAVVVRPSSCEIGAPMRRTNGRKMSRAGRGRTPRRANTASVPCTRRRASTGSSSRVPRSCPASPGRSY